MPRERVTRRNALDGQWSQSRVPPDDPRRPVLLARTRQKGWGLFAARRIPKGHDVAYFRMLVHDAREFNARRFVQHAAVEVLPGGEVQTSDHGPKRVLWEGGAQPPPGPLGVGSLSEDRVVLEGGWAFENPLLNANNSYAMQVYDQHERRLRPDLIMDVFERSRGVSPEGVPYWGHFCNEPDAGQDGNARLMTLRDPRGRSPQAGDVIEVRLVARRAIRPMEEVVWDYGAQYDRCYASGQNPASIPVAVRISGERQRQGRTEYRVQWADGKTTWEHRDKLVNEEAVRLVTEFRRRQPKKNL